MMYTTQFEFFCFKSTPSENELLKKNEAWVHIADIPLISLKWIFSEYGKVMLTWENTNSKCLNNSLRITILTKEQEALWKRIKAGEFDKLETIYLYKKVKIKNGIQSRNRPFNKRNRNSNSR